jgi:hypothetical protein
MQEGERRKDRRRGRGRGRERGREPMRSRQECQGRQWTGSLWLIYSMDFNSYHSNVAVMHQKASKTGGNSFSLLDLSGRE